MHRSIAGVLAAIMCSASAAAQPCVEGWIPQFPDVSFSAGIHGMLERVEDGEPVVYLVGDFTFAAGVRAPQVVRWDGSFASMGDPPGGSAHKSLVVVDPDGAGPEPERFFIGGGDGPTNSGRVAMWDGTQWQRAAESLPRNDVRRLRVLDDGTGERLHAFGHFNGVFARNAEGGWDQIV